MGFLSSVGVLVCFSLINDSTAKAVIGFAGTGAVSHQAAFARVGLELVERGHKFAILVSAGDKLTQARFAKPPFENLRQILYSGPPELGTDKWLSNLERAPQKMAAQLRHDGLSNSRSLLEDNETIALLRAERFDLVLTDVVLWPTGLLSQILEIPEIDMVTSGAILPFFGPRYSIPNPIAYAPQMTTTLLPALGFWQRVQNYLQYRLLKLLVMSDASKEERALSNEFGYTADGQWTRKSTAAAAISTGDWALEYPFPLPPKVHMVGPIMAELGKPLVGELADFLDGKVTSKTGASPPQQAGAVYVSMGTAVRLLEPEIRGFAANLAALTRPVLWKLSDAELPGNMTVESLKLPKRVRAITWAPQNDVLAHAGTKVFVTHGGANSLYEAAYNGIPIVALPIFAEQPHNAAKSVYHGFGIIVPIAKVRDDGKWLLRNAITKILEDESFQANATKVQKRLVKARTPVQQAADVVEHVLATGGEDYLDTAAHLYTWWQLALLDVYLVLFMGIALVLGTVGALLWLVARWAQRAMGVSKPKHKVT